MRQLLSMILVGVGVLLTSVATQAQFSFTYTGPDSIIVGDNCTGILDWGHPETPQAFPTVPGQVVISFTIFSISGGYMIGDSVPAGEIVTVFYEARDNMGHIVLFGFNLPFVDTIPPMFDPATIPQDVTVQCGDDLPDASILFSDNCDSDTAMTEVVFEESGSVDVCTGGVITRTWTLTDPFGNTAQHSQLITVEQDTSAPVITGLPQDGSAPCGDAMDAYMAWIDSQRAAFMAEDMGCGVMEIFDNAPNPQVLLGFCGEITVDFFAADSCGNSASVSASFFVTNETAPEIITPASDDMADCGSGNPTATFNAWINTQGGAEAADDCSIITWSTDPPNPSLSDACDGAILVTFITDDGCGNTATTSAQFFVQDTVPPQIQSDANNRIVNCSAVDVIEDLGNWLSNYGGAQAMDICTESDSLTVHFEINGTVLDSAGVIAAFEDSILTGCVDGVIVDGIIWNNVLALIEVQFVFSDACGNAAGTPGIFGITDAVGPEFASPPEDITITCGTSGELDSLFSAWYESAGNAVGMDDCGSVFYRGSPDQLSALGTLQAALDTACGAGASVAVAFYINDFCGNENPDSVVAMFTVIDSVGPELVEPAADLEFACSGDPQVALENWLDTLGGAQAMDLCGAVSWLFTWVVGSDTLSGVPQTGPYPDLATIDCTSGLEVIFTASDLCGNPVASVATFEFVDTVAPQLSVQEPVVVLPCDSLPGSSGVTVTDNCTDNPMVTYIDVPVNSMDTTSCAQYSGVILRTWIATDGCGNSATATQTFEITDNTPPVLIPPGDTMLACTGSFDPAVTGSPLSVNDNCDPDPHVTYVDMMSGTGCAVTIERMWIATDACMNADTAIQIISFIDTIAPAVMSISPEVLVSCDASVDVPSAFSEWLASGSGVQLADACGNAFFFVAQPGTYVLGDTTTYPGTPPLLPPADSCSASGMGTLAEVIADVVYYDPCGNSGNVEVRFAVVDTTPPVIQVCPPDMMQEIDSACMATFTLMPPTVVESCLDLRDTILLSMTIPVSSVSPGDTMQPVQPMLFVFDNVPTPPAGILDPVTITVVLDGVDADGPEEYFNVLSEEDLLIGQTDPLPVECDSAGTVLMLDAGQVAAWSVDGSISFTLDPNIPQGMPGDLAINDICPGGMVTVILQYVVSTPQQVTYAYAVDDGPRVDLDSFGSYVLTLAAGVHVVTSFVSDCSGNEDSCHTELVVFDGTAPEVVCPPDIVANSDGGGCQAIVTLRAPDVTENCGLQGTPEYVVTGATVIAAQPFPVGADSVLEVFNAGVSVVTYIVEDLSGNVDSCTFSVTVSDDIPPAAVCQDALVFVHPAGNVPLILDPEVIDAGSDDNCGIDTMYVVPAIFPCDSAGTEQMVDLVVADANGNQDTCTSVVRIEVAPLMPTFEVGICEDDTLKLFANVPDAPGNPYTFSWSGPQNFVSNLENPVIPGAGSAESGTYVLVVTGFGGCTSMGSVAVVIEDINVPEIFTESETICEGDPVILQASGFNQPVTYHWYRGTPPGGLLLGTSANPTFIDIPPVAGDYSYYVVVESADCTSNPSQSVFVSVVTAPEAMVNDLFLEVCEGESIVLGTDIIGPGITYQWTGPNGFSSSEQYPPAITEAVEEDEGVYNLVIVLGDCMSEPASTVVIVDPRPDQPVINGDSLFCEGGQLTLVVNNVEDADQYIWNHPNGSSIPTLSNALTLSGIGEDVEGMWTVVAMLGDCASEPSAPFQVHVESSLLITTSNTGPVCVGDSVTLLVQLIPDATYNWTGPGGFVSQEPNPTLLAVEGNYQLEVVSQSGCTASSSTMVVVDEAPTITALSNTAGMCADGSQTLGFAVTLFPEDDGAYTYSWSGPGFTSGDSSPVIANLTSANNGTYALVVFQGNCPSDTAFTVVDVTDSPDKPEIGGAQNWCAGSDLILTAGGYDGDSVLYMWTTPLGVMEILNDSVLVITNVQGAAAGEFAVVVTVDGCPSVSSDTAVITISPQLAQPVIAGPDFVCEGDSLILTTASVSEASFHWTGPGGFEADGQTVVIYPALAVNAGSYQVIVERGPCLSPVSDPFTVEVRTRPAQPALEPYNGTICLDDPGVFTICLDEASTTPDATYTWLVGHQDTIEVATPTVCIDVTDVSSFIEGLNEITVIAEQAGCPSAASDPLMIEAVRYPDEQADAGADRLYCAGDAITLEALTPLEGQGQWSSLGGNAVFANPSDPTTAVTGLQEGVNQLVWSLDFASCLGYSADTVEITIERSPDLTSDTVFVDFGMTVEIEVLANDILPGEIMPAITIAPARGNALMNAQGEIIYTPNIGYVGPDEIRYEVCSAQCPTQCDETVVVIQVGDENDCFVPTIFTPNGDGVNDLLTIPCLETDRFPGNRIVVFNVWGDAVFEAGPYENDWDGTRDGKELPVGTYYYVVDFGDNSPVRKGFLIIER